VEVTFTRDVHPDADTLEEYALERLSPVVTEKVEEHLLICGPCQITLAEIDEYVLLMKQATARLAPSVRGARPESARASRWARVGMGAMMVAIVLGALMLWPSRAKPIAHSVELVALRGDPAASIAHAPAGPLDLRMDVSDLPEVASFRLEVVDAAGQRRWQGEATAIERKLTVRVRKTLGRGTYWVRLSASEGEPLREFGLRTD